MLASVTRDSHYQARWMAVELLGTMKLQRGQSGHLYDSSIRELWLTVKLRVHSTAWMEQKRKNYDRRHR